MKITLRLYTHSTRVNNRNKLKHFVAKNNCSKLVAFVNLNKRIWIKWIICLEALSDGHFSFSQIRTESSFKFSSSSVGSFPISLLSHFLSATSKYLGFSPKNDTLFLKMSEKSWNCRDQCFSHPFYLHEIKNWGCNTYGAKCCASK